VRITTLIENSPGSDDRLHSEHGLSLFVEANGVRMLFDLGPSPRFAANAEVLGLDLAAADLAVISHGHFDHGGGLARFLELNDHAPVFLRRTADGPHYSAALTRERYIGLDLDVLASRPERLRWVDGETEAAPGVHLLTAIPRSEPRPAGNARLFLKAGDSFVPDPFDHELVCVVREPDGMVVLTGCAHSGATNMVRAAKARFPDDPIKGVVGGFHLALNAATGALAMEPKEVKAFARMLTGLGCARVATGHCTGDKAASLLQGRLGERLTRLRTGTVLEL